MRVLDLAFIEAQGKGPVDLEAAVARLIDRPAEAGSDS